MSLTTPHLEHFLVNPPPDGEDSVSIPRDNLGLPGAPAGSSTFEATPGCDQVRELLSCRDQTFQPRYCYPTRVQFEAWLGAGRPALVQMELQPNFLRYEATQASTTEFYYYHDLIVH